jgi:archaellum biogenesis protein FlaJ (TadC family)
VKNDREHVNFDDASKLIRILFVARPMPLVIFVTGTPFAVGAMVAMYEKRDRYVEGGREPFPLFFRICLKQAKLLK